MAEIHPTTAHDALLAALKRIVRPLLRICFRTGVSMAELRAVLDHAAVREAESFFLAAGKKPTYSNISIVTGIQRRQVARLLRITHGEGPISDGALHRATRVLNGWREDPLFLTKTGTTADLPIAGRAKSFESLVSRYAGGVSASAILRFMIEDGSVEVIKRDATGHASVVRARANTAAGAVSTARAFREFGELLGDAFDTFDERLSSPNDKEVSAPRSVRVLVRTTDVAAVQRLLRQHTDFFHASMTEALQRFDLAPEEAIRLEHQDPASVLAVRSTAIASLKSRSHESAKVERAWRRRFSDGQTPAESKTDRPKSRPTRTPKK